MRCHLCTQQRPLIKAHILPEPFFAAYGRGGGAPKLLSNSPDEWPKRLPIGFYDKSILCADCDARLGTWDQYGVEILFRRLNDLEAVYHDNELIALTRKSYDHTRLKLFVVSVLWRAGISSLRAMRRVALGPYADEARRLILSESPGGPDDFSVVLSVFTRAAPPGIVPAPIMDPFRERWNGANSYRLSFGAITAYVKVDQAIFPPKLRALMLAPNTPLHLVGRDYLSSTEAVVVSRIIEAPQNRRAFWST